MTVKLMTAGYEGGTADDFIAKLKAAGVRRVIDVRELPSSRKRGLSKGPLSTRLAEEGIDYVHLKALGTPKAIRDEYKRDHDFAKLSRRFLPFLEERPEALHTVFELARERPSVLICYEHEATLCHRSLVARRVAEMFGSEEPVQVVDL